MYIQFLSNHIIIEKPSDTKHVNADFKIYFKYNDITIHMPGVGKPKLDRCGKFNDTKQKPRWRFKKPRKISISGGISDSWNCYKSFCTTRVNKRLQRFVIRRVRMYPMTFVRTRCVDTTRFITSFCCFDFSL